ncbi:DMT family transporter [Flavobacteriaceae bacterium]|nr:EamA family transporter [Flavobacteriaceae bacterium]MBT4232264.1 EamA family transporter [Flavobacteriaceae bacterium]MBT5392512.1 EamA family transporter [Flavobacteriaceae bacterium]MBT7572867.1 EamA family transporter [Flavobacteriaceae bacterium]MBT7984594.1 EamA family transporter [Flavobacteriaceae bacterium]
MSNRSLGFLAAFGATLIYGLNHTVAKNVMPVYIGPYAFILLRVIGASILFWTVSLFIKTEKIDKKDWPRIILCSFLGMVINMLAFFKGLELSTPVNSSVMITLSPIIVFIFSAILLKEKIESMKAFGIASGFVGALILVLYTAKTGVNAPNIPMGNLLFIVNSFAYGLYLVLVKPLISKYNIITLLKWLFLLGVIMNFPVTISQFSEVEWTNLPLKEAIIPMAFVVIGTTFFTYLFNAYALTKLTASSVSSFIYLQPIVGIVFAISTKSDSLTLISVVGMILIFIGIYLVTKKTVKT